MDIARQFALHAYRMGTSPYRWRLRRRLESAGQAPIGILFYHRVADTSPNAWSISNQCFQQQILWLKKHFDVVSLEEAQQRIESGQNDRVAVAITFDDGYAENCERALPFLVQQQVPATYFVSLDFIVKQRPFPHDVAAGCPLPVNTPDQIRDLAAAGIEIGAHTRNHCDVGAINDPQTMIDEVVTASNELADLMGRPIRYFAFPYGQPRHLSAAAVELTRTSGMSGICSAFGAYNFPGQDAFHLRRIHADPEMARLRNWMTLDPRKLHCDRGFQIS